MNDRGMQALWIHGYQVVPEEMAVYGPHGRLRMQPAAMVVLLKLAERAESAVTPAELQHDLGRFNKDERFDIDVLIHELRACFDDPQDKPLFITGSKDAGFMLNTPAFPVDKNRVTSIDPSAMSPTQKLRAEHNDETRRTAAPPVAEDLEDDFSPSWIKSLKRRRVFRVMGSYLVGSWLVMQIADVMSGAFPVPDWTAAAVAMALAIGFPIVAGLTWAFQMTPRGVELDVDTETPIPPDRARIIHFVDLVIIGVLLVAVALLSFGKFFPFLPEEEVARIAVLPFQELSDNSDEHYLGQGISDDIRSRLHGVPQVKIAARASTMALADDNLDIKTIGERLTVQHVLDGSVRRIGNRVRVVAQLVDVGTGFDRWSKIYDTTIDDVLDVQSNIALYVTSELEILLSRDIRQSLAKVPTDNPAAYDVYLQAQSFLDRPKTSENLDKALMLFRQAIDKDINFALGYAGLCRTHIARYQTTGDTAFFAAAETNCERALAIDTDLPQVHSALGHLYVQEGQFDKARTSFDSALKLDAENLSALTGLGLLYVAQGEDERAETQYRKAIELVPGNWNGYNVLAGFLLKRGRYDEAIDNYRRILRFAPDNELAYNDLGAAYFLKGDFAQAAAHYQRSLELAPGRGAYSNTASMHYFAGNFEEAAETFAKAVELTDTDYRLWGNLADAQRYLPNGSELAAVSYTKAIELAEAQLQVNPNDLSIQSHLALYHANLGNNEEARALLQASDEVSPNDLQLQYLRALTYALLGNKEVALTMLEQVKQLGFPQAVIDATPELSQIMAHDLNQ